MLLKLLFSHLIQLLLVVWSVGTLTFILMRSLSGDMAYRIAGSRYGYDQVDSAAAELVRQEIGLDAPWYQAYMAWFGDLLRLDLGNSFVSGISVWQEIAHQLGHTVALAWLALLMAFVVSVPLGVLCAKNPDGLLDKLTLFFSITLRSTPTFIIGVLLITLFAIQLHVLPALGYGSPTHYVLPALTLALPLIATTAQVSKKSTISTLSSPYYEFAQLKGLSARQAFLRHGLRNIAIPIIAYLGVQLIYLIEGVVIVESLFAWPGIGHALVHAIIARDVPMIQGTALVMGAMFVLLNALVDVISHWIDPRFRPQ